MRFYLLSILALVFSLSVISCQKELSPYLPQTGTDSTTIPIDTTGADTGAYQPVTVGSFWTYKDSASGSETTNLIGDSTRPINNILFSQYLTIDDNGTDTSWIASPAPNYYVAAQQINPTTNTPFQLIFYYLNDTASVGSSWTYAAGSGAGFTVQTQTTIVAKNLTLTVEGKTYTDVTQTHLDITYTTFNQTLDYGGYEYFVAKGIGFIKIRTLANVNGNEVTQSCLNLVGYEIK